MRLTILDAAAPDQPFPPSSAALKEPNGLLAVGGCLSTKRLLNAYRHGVFPWYNPGDPILWWSPNPRLVLFPDKLSVSRSLKKTLRKKTFTFSFDKAFDAVVDNCAGIRKEGSGTWITSEIKRAFKQLHRLGHAHSIETWSDGELVGGLYGIAVGRVFFGESMFHKKTDASKVAFVTLVELLSRWNYRLIDCQVQTAHLESLGAQLIDRDEFEFLLDRFCDDPPSPCAWRC